MISPEKPWEGNDVRFRNIIFDEVDQVFKLWYDAREHSAQQGDGEIIVKGEFDDEVRTCLAVSEDAINWERPNLGTVEFGGSKNNNILAPDQQLPLLAGQRDSNTYFFQDNHEQDPSKRYKVFVRTGSTTTPGMQFHLYFSKDALTGFRTKTTLLLILLPEWDAGDRQLLWDGIVCEECTQCIWRTVCIGGLLYLSG